MNGGRDYIIVLMDIDGIYILHIPAYLYEMPINPIKSQVTIIYG